jgi:hypothetical protein
LTEEQLEALDDINLQVVGDNKCDRDANALLQLYPLYDVSRGVYTDWGDIPFSWDSEDLLSDERWNVARYVTEFSYEEDDIVVRIEEDGYRVVVYKAIGDIPSPAGAFNPPLWEEVCHVCTAEPVGLPTYPELASQYGYYSAGTTYSKDSIVLVDSFCGDFTCVYIATSSPGLVAPPSPVWQKMYCVKNGKPYLCEKGVKCDKPNTRVISLSSDPNDLICIPVESYLDARVDV